MFKSCEALLQQAKPQIDDSEDNTDEIVNDKPVDAPSKMSDQRDAKRRVARIIEGFILEKNWKENIHSLTLVDPNIDDSGDNLPLMSKNTFFITFTPLPLTSETEYTAGILFICLRKLNFTAAR